MRPRIAAFAALLGAAAVAGCALPPPGAPSTTLTPVSFSQLPGWREAKPAEVLRAFVQGCAALAQLPPRQSVGGSGEAARLGGDAGQWTRVCTDASGLKVGDEAAARAFFERDFQPYALGSGLVTGYYEPEVRGSLRPSELYQVPLLRLPPDLVHAELGAFDPDLKGKRITGRLSGSTLVPYYSRREIDDGALDGDHLALAWLSDPIEAFFLQIQGSGRVILPDGQVLRVTYAGQNGRRYVAIGKLLQQRGAIAPGQVTMQSVRAWLAAHPEQGRAVMEEDPSYVFFKEVTGLGPDDGPPGTLGAPLTPGRSVAVDPRVVPLGAPLWLDSTDPTTGKPWHGMVVAQDTGGAVKGQGRIDLFFGWGPQAADAAGRMEAQGQSYVLLPKGRPAA